MQFGIVRGPGDDCTVAQPEDAAHAEPQVAGQECERNEAGQARAADGAAGDVVAAEPERVAGERGAAETDAGVGINGGEGEAGKEQDGQSRKEGLTEPGQAGEGRQLEPLADDREDEEAGPPGHHLHEREASEPERVACHPEDSRQQEHARGGRRARAHDHHKERNEDAASKGKRELACSLTDAGEQQRGPRDGPRRREVTPGTAKGDGTLERDHGAEEAEHHQRPVQLDQVGASLRQAPAEPQQPGPDAAEEGRERKAQQRKAEARDRHSLFYTILMSFSGSGDRLVEAVRSALSSVEDPELGLDIVSLGLVYGIEHEQGHVQVVHTLTSMGCPLGPVIERDIADALANVAGIESVAVQLVFDPPWSPEKMSDDARFLLGVYS